MSEFPFEPVCTEQFAGDTVRLSARHTGLEKFQYVLLRRQHKFVNLAYPLRRLAVNKRARHIRTITVRFRPYIEQNYVAAFESAVGSGVMTIGRILAESHDVIESKSVRT